MSYRLHRIIFLQFNTLYLHLFTWRICTYRFFEVFHQSFHLFLVEVAHYHPLQLTCFPEFIYFLANFFVSVWFQLFLSLLYRHTGRFNSNFKYTFSNLINFSWIKILIFLLQIFMSQFEQFLTLRTPMHIGNNRRYFLYQLFNSLWKPINIDRKFIISLYIYR